MVKQISDYIDIVSLEDVESISAGVITLKEGKVMDRILADNNLIPDEEPVELKGNPCFKQTLKLIAEKLSLEISARYRNGRPVIILLYASDNTTPIWGDLAVPVRVNLAPKSDHDVLDFVRFSPDSLL